MTYDPEHTTLGLVGGTGSFNAGGAVVNGQPALIALHQIFIRLKQQTES